MELESSLQQEQKQSADLQSRLEQLEKDAEDASDLLETLQTQEKTLSEKLKEQVSEISKRSCLANDRCRSATFSSLMAH